MEGGGRGDFGDGGGRRLQRQRADGRAVNCDVGGADGRGWRRRAVGGLDGGGSEGRGRCDEEEGRTGGGGCREGDLIRVFRERKGYGY
ncbi:unnamed protein product [Linum trigynum]|uniref:Uncharacterized protein n=1 Tax=Linum trigynum TaxID=586398 RepID=A0AAV2G3W5_9ROSI